MIRVDMRRRKVMNLDYSSQIVQLNKFSIDFLFPNKTASNFVSNNKTLYLLSFYYWCILIATTSAVADEHDFFLKAVNNNKVWNDSNYNAHENYFVTFNKAYENISKSLETESNLAQRRQILSASNTQEGEEDEYESDEIIEDFHSHLNNSVKGLYVGASCEENCNSKLHHVTCDPITKTCNCDRNHPVLIGIYKGCAKPKQLGEQCFYHQTCKYNDENSLCVQVRHNALCRCAPGYHSVAYTKPTKRIFCTEDLAAITSDLPTLLGVTTGIAVLAGLICMVLHLFSKTKYPRHRNLADANVPPPIMYSSDTGISLAGQSGRPSSRSSIHSNGSIGSYGNRRPSSEPHSGTKGVLVSTSRTGSRRASLASVHSTSSSIRSYGMLRFEKEVQQKEIRNEMRLRLARLQQQQQQDLFSQSRSQIAPVIMIGPSASPLTPNSLDGLLPSVDESQEIFLHNIESGISNNISYQRPCSSSNNAT